MTVRRWVQRGNKLIEIPNDYKPQRPVAPMIMRDISPYRSIITNEEISSRSHHREHLRAHNCIEIGDQKPQWMRDRRPGDPATKETSNDDPKVRFEWKEIKE